MEKIPEYIQVPEQIIEAVNNNELVVFLGAGVSRIIGCKGWDELAQNLLKVCLDNENSDNKPYLNYRGYDRLQKSRDHKKTITICHDLLEEGGDIELFYKEFGEALNEKNDKLKKYPIYKVIHQLNAISITTNADNHYDDFFDTRNIKKTPKQFADFNVEDELNNRFLFKIHGHYDKNNKKSREFLIFTADKYVNQYNDKKFKEFLIKIFQSSYTVLFIGYGLSEFELIDYLITKANPNKRHYLIKNYFSEEVNLLKYDKMYYNKLHLEILPYAIDHKGYDQLFFVIKDIVYQINEKSNSLINRTELLEELVEKVSKS